MPASKLFAVHMQRLGGDEWRSGGRCQFRDSGFNHCRIKPHFRDSRFGTRIKLSGFGIRDSNHMFGIPDSGCGSRVTFSGFGIRDSNHISRIRNSGFAIRDSNRIFGIRDSGLESHFRDSGFGMHMFGIRDSNPEIRDSVLGRPHPRIRDSTSSHSPHNKSETHAPTEYLPKSHTTQQNKITPAN